MQTTICRLIPGIAFLLLSAFAWPLWAQQVAAPRTQNPQRPAPRQSAPQRTAPRTAQQAPARSQQTAPNRQADGPRARGPVRQAAATEAQPAAPQAPFQLTPAQQALLNQILLKWQTESNRIKTFTCTFGRWEVNKAFGPANNNYWLSIAEGEIKFKAPDHGVYIVNKQDQWDGAKGRYLPRTEGLEHWVCNGKSIFEFDGAQKKLIERELAPELQGKAITDGPLPFVFGTNAAQLQRRYWMRDITPRADVNNKIWLEAWPKFQSDKANFHHAIVILNQKDFLPTGLRIFLPDGKNLHDYAFNNSTVNNPLAILTKDFWEPMRPLGWTKEVIPANAAARVAPPANAPGQAQRPVAPAQRK